MVHSRTARRLGGVLAGVAVVVAGFGAPASARAGGAGAGPSAPRAVAGTVAGIPSGSGPVAGRPLAHTSLGTVFAEDGTSRIAYLADDGSSSTSLPSFDATIVSAAFGCGTSFVTDNSGFAPIAPGTAPSAAPVGAFQWRDLSSGDSGSRAPSAGRVLVGAAPGGWVEQDASSHELFRVDGLALTEVSLGMARQGSYGCGSSGYADITPQAVDGSVSVEFCAWGGACTDLADDPSGDAYQILAVSGTTVVYQSLVPGTGTADSTYQVWRVTKNGSGPTLVYSTTDGDVSSAAIATDGTAFFTEGSSTTPAPGIVGFTPVGESATTWAATGGQGPMVLTGASGALFASVGCGTTGIAGVDATGVTAISPWWMHGLPTYRPLTPQRILDTRYGIGAGKRYVPDGAAVRLRVAGVAGIPSGCVAAVDLNVTVVGPKGGGFVTVYPTGTTRPTASSLNYSTNQVIANHVITAVGGDGQIFLYVSRSTNLIADVSGWYPTGAAYTAMTPTRILDTRYGTGAPKGAVPAGGSRTITVLGAGGPDGVPTDPAQVDSVVVNLTDVGSTGSGYVTAWPAGQPRPVVSNVNYRRGQVFAGLAIVKVGAGGAITLYTSATSQLVADVVGWVPTGSEYTGLSPARIRDTRYGVGGPQGIRPAGSTMVVPVEGQGLVPGNGVKAVMVNVTVTQAVGTGYLTVYPSNSAKPTASTLNFVRGDTLSNSIVAPLGADGAIRIYVSQGTHVVVDVSGWFAAD